MTFMPFVLLVFLFISAFIYFFGLNPQDVTVFYYPNASITYNIAVVFVGCILLGMTFGYIIHLLSLVNHMIKHWKRDRAERQNREVAAIFREGVGRLLSGDYKRARSLLQKALERDPGRAETCIALANVHLQDGEPQEAVNLLVKARNIEPKNLEVLFKLAAAYEACERSEEAMRAYRSILDHEDGNRKALRGLRDLLIRDGKWLEALELQKRVLKLASEKRRSEEQQILFFLRYEVARGALEREDIDTAKGEFKEILREDPNFAPARVSLGDAYRAQGRGEVAVRVWLEGYRRLGRGVFLARLEDYYLGMEDPGTLLELYRNAVQEHEDDLMLRFFFGKLCLRLEMVDEALEQLMVVDNAGVDIPQLHLLLAEAYRRRNRIDDAIHAYQKALGVTRQLRFGYLCDNCGEESEEWLSRCPSCGNWGSFIVAGRQSLRDAKPLDLRPIHHGQREAWVDA